MWVDHLKQTVTSSSDALRKRVEAVLDMAVTTVSSLGEAFTSKLAHGLDGHVAEGEKPAARMADAEVVGRGEDSHSEESDVDSLLEVHD